MAESILKRENTIGITYVKGEIEEPHYELVIEKTFGVPESEIFGIDDRGNTRFCLKW